MDEYSLTEILRLHLESSGAYRSEKSLLWLYQQRGGYKLSDDPGLQFRMEEPQILEALATKMVYQLSFDEKMKILHCLMNQILSYATVRDEIDEVYFSNLFQVSLSKFFVINNCQKSLSKILVKSLSKIFVNHLSKKSLVGNLCQEILSKSLVELFSKNVW